MKSLRKTLLALLLVLSACSIQAQNFRLYTSDNQLSNSLINQIYQDHIGYIWVCTEYGLNKFDGQRFTHYYHQEEDPFSIKADYVRVLFEDNKQRLWVGCISGLMLYSRDKDGFEQIPLYVNDKEVNPHVTGIIQRHNGEVWLCTSGQGVFILSQDGKRGDCQVALTHKIGTKFLGSICEDSHNNMWFGSGSDGLIYYNPISKQVHIYRRPELSCDRVQSLVEDREGHLFVGTLDNGLYRIDLKDFGIHQIPYPNGTPIIKTLYLNSNGQVIIGTDGQGVKFYDKATQTMRDKTIENINFPLDKGKIHAILEDRDGNHWIGLFQKGVISVPPQEKQFHVWTICDRNQRTQMGSVCAMHEDNKGDIWTAVDCDGLYLTNKAGAILRHYPVSKDNIPSTILSVFQDSNGQIWLGSYGSGLNKFNPETGICTPISQIDSKYVTSMVEGADRKLYVGTLEGGLWVLDLNTHATQHILSSRQNSNDTRVNELPNDYICSLLMDKHQRLWIGHYLGLTCYDTRKKSFVNNPWKSNNILTGDVCYSILYDKGENLWCGTRNGLVKLNSKNKKINRYTSKNGLNNDIVCTVLEDNQGNIWCSTYMGICELNTQTGTWSDFFVTDGLQGSQFTNNSGLKDTDGRLYFGGTNGISLFQPTQTEKVSRKLKVDITGFYVYDTSINSRSLSDGGSITNKAIEEAESLHLSHNDNTFTIEFTTFNFSNPERIGYQYKLQGLSNEWTTTRPGVNKVTYNKLPPGTYRFIVRAYENDNYSEERTLTIYIASPWYASGLAIFCYILFILGVLGYLAYLSYSRWNEHQLMLKREQEDQINEAKLQFFINISHEIRTPMTLIINPLEKLLKECGEGELKKTYAMMYRNGQRILRLINQLLDVRKLDKGQMFIKCRETDMVGFIQDLMHTFEYQATKKSIRFEFQHDMEHLPVWIDINQFDKVLLNLLSNAFKFTPDQGEVCVSLQTEPATDEFPQGYFVIRVADTGIGINKEKIDHIFERFYQISNEVTNTSFGTGIGLHLTRSLVELHHGTIKAANRTDVQGAVFSVRLPLGNSYLSDEELTDPSTKLAQTVAESHPNRKNFEEQEAHNETLSLGSHHKTRYTILLSEDEEEILNYLQEEFTNDYKILTAHNGREALEITQRENPDLIVSDVMMPVMDGVTFCKKLKHNPNICHIPIILLTAKSKFEDEMEGLEIGADAYIIKPFNTEQLRKVIQNLISNRERLKNKFTGVQQQEDKIESITMKSADEQLMERIMKAINENLSNSSLSVEMIAGEVGISRVHLHRKLKELTSLSARDFIKSIRMKQAANLLSAKKMSISEVAYATGYNTLSHFSSSFHDYFGQTPKEFMNAANANQPTHE